MFGARAHIRIEALLPLVLAAGVLAFFVAIWFFKGPYLVHDIVTVMAPVEDLFGRIQRAGESPLWAPEIHGGYPLLAFGQLGYYYPPHMLLRHFLPGVWVINVSLAGHVLLGMLGMWGLVRAQKIPPWASALAALVYVFGGASVARFAHVGMVLPLAWLPIAVMVLDRVVRFRQTPWGWLLVWIGANVAQGMAGHPQSALMGVIVQTVWLGVLCVQEPRLVKRCGRLLVGSILIIGFLLSHLLPVLAVVSQTDRAAGLSEDELFEFSGPPAALFGLIIPHPFGRGETYVGPKGEAELALYVGPVVVGLACLGLVWGRRKLRREPLLLAGLCLVGSGILLGLGEHSLVYRWLALHTPQSFFSVPVRYFILLHIGIIFLAAWAHTRLGRAWQPLVAIVGVLPILLVAWQWESALPTWEAAKTPWAVAVLQADKYVGRVWVDDSLVDKAPGDNFGITVGGPIDRARHWRQSLTSPYGRSAGVRLTLSRAAELPNGQLQVRLESATGDVVREVAVEAADIINNEPTTILFAEVSTEVGASFVVDVSSTWETKDAPRLLLHTNPDGLDFDPTGSLELCRGKSCEAVVVDDGSVDAAVQFVAPAERTLLSRELLMPHIGASYGIASGQWTGALPLAVVKNYLVAADDNRVLQDRLGITHRVGWSPPYREVDEESGVEAAALAYDSGFIHIMRSTTAWPRWHYASTVMGDVREDEQLDALRGLEQSSDTVVTTWPGEHEFPEEGKLSLVQEERTLLHLQSERASDGFLVVRDVLLPGWEARVDGDLVPQYTTDALWRGLPVPVGQHDIVFTYRPSWVPLALGGSVAAWIGAMVLVRLWLRQVRSIWQKRLQRRDAIAN